MATIETVLGSSQELDNNSIVYHMVEKTARKVPVITANFLTNVKGCYVVAEAPENLVQIITDAVAGTEKGLANLYVEELEAWNSKQMEILEEYKLEQEIHGEAARKKPVELIFDALERKGKAVGALRTQYRQLGKLSGLRTEFLLKFLSQAGINDELIHEDVKAMLNKSELLDEDRTWNVLVNRLGVKAPLPEKPAPEIKLKDVPQLIGELEAVVIAAFKMQPLEGIEVSSSVWAELGIDLSSVYSKVAESFLRLNNNYFLVKTTGIGQADGSVKVVELDRSKNGLKNGTPRQLRGNLRLPTEIVYDVYKLFVTLVHVYDAEIQEKYPKLPDDEQIGASVIVLEKLLKGKRSLVCALHPRADIEKFDDYEKNYGEFAEATARRIEKGEKNYGNFNLRGSAVISASEVLDVVNYLAGLVPEELHLLRKVSIVRQAHEERKKEIERGKVKGNALETESLLRKSEESYRSLFGYLSYLAEGARRWSLKEQQGLDLSVLELYGLNHVGTGAKINKRGFYH